MLPIDFITLVLLEQVEAVEQYSRSDPSSRNQKMDRTQPVDKCVKLGGLYLEPWSTQAPLILETHYTLSFSHQTYPTHSTHTYGPPLCTFSLNIKA